MANSELLEKYIAHVIDCEGTDHLEDEHPPNWPNGPQFTEDEWRELKSLAEPIWTRLRKRT